MGTGTNTRIYRFAELAMQYFPDVSKEYASRLLSQCISKSVELTRKLHEAGYKKYAKILTPKQISIIMEHLGEP